MILFLSPYWSKKIVKLLVNICPIIFVASKNTIVTYLGCQSDPKKFITRVNISCAPFDIHKSKLVVVEIQFVNFGKTYTRFIFSTKLGNISWKSFFLKGNTTLGNKCNTKRLNHTLSTKTTMVSYFSQSKGQGPKKVFLLHIILFERLFYNNKKKILHLLEHLAFSLHVVFQKFLLFHC